MKAWVALTALGFWLGLLFLLALAFSGCAESPAGEAEQLEHRFARRPVTLVASTELPTLCMRALDHAVLWYRERHATLVLEAADPSDPVLSGLVVNGEVGVVPGKLSPGVRGETRLALSLTGDSIIGAEITLADCSALVVAHEVGHALGAVHVSARGNLMHPTVEGGGWELSEDQLRWIADPQ